MLLHTWYTHVTVTLHINPTGRGAGQPGSPEPSTLPAAAWTPGLVLSSEGLLSEVITLRGARRAGKLAPAAEAAAVLDSWLVADGE